MIDGDKTQFVAGAPPTFAEVSRGACAMMLAQPVHGAPGMRLYFDPDTPAELEAIHHEFQHSAARIVEPPDDKPWGMRELLVQDLDVHTYGIAAPIR
jgi:hypothetical protein